jgi:hypothetical protein
MKWSCLYEAAVCLVFGVLKPPLPITAHRIAVRKGMPWEDMGINGNLWGSGQKQRPRTAQQADQADTAKPTVQFMGNHWPMITRCSAKAINSRAG